MAATTTENNTSLPNPTYLRPYSTQCGYSTGAYPFLIFSTDGSSGANHQLGGFCAISTGMEQARFPINSPGAKSLIVAVFEGIGPTSTYYGFVGVRRGVGSDNPFAGQSTYQPAGTTAYSVYNVAAKNGWKFFETTAALIQAATENATYILGPVDLGPYYQSLGMGSSGASIDKYQHYIQLTAGYSSIAMNNSTIAYSEFSTNHPVDCDSGVYVAHFEVP